MARLHVCYTNLYICENKDKILGSKVPTTCIIYHMDLKIKRFCEPMGRVEKNQDTTSTRLKLVRLMFNSQAHPFFNKKGDKCLNRNQSTETEIWHPYGPVLLPMGLTRTILQQYLLFKMYIIDKHQQCLFYIKRHCNHVFGDLFLNSATLVDLIFVLLRCDLII